MGGGSGIYVFKIISGFVLLHLLRCAVKVLVNPFALPDYSPLEFGSEVCKVLVIVVGSGVWSKKMVFVGLFFSFFVRFLFFIFTLCKHFVNG